MEVSINAGISNLGFQNIGQKSEKESEFGLKNVGQKDEKDSDFELKDVSQKGGTINVFA
ncbi:MAG: hypothetical protein ACE5GU_09265 [Candidatus Scalinduaceae bacterium]